MYSSSFLEILNKKNYSIHIYLLYRDPQTKYVVICKILVDSLAATLEKYGEYVEAYLHWEERIESDDGEKIVPKNGYDNTNLINVLFYHTTIFILTPFIGVKEIFVAAKNVMARDFGWFIPKNWVDTINGLTRDEMIAQLEAAEGAARSDIKGPLPPIKSVPYEAKLT